MDYGAGNVIYIDRRATDDVCDAAENRYEQDHRPNQHDQAQAQAQEQDHAYKHGHTHLQQKQHKDSDDAPSSTAATTTTITSASASSTATAGAGLDRDDASRRRPAYHQRQPPEVCRNLDAILGIFARGKNELAQRVTAYETSPTYSEYHSLFCRLSNNRFCCATLYKKSTRSFANNISSYRISVFVCTSGQSCLDKIDELYQSPHLSSTISSLSASSKKIPESSPPPPPAKAASPTIVLIDVTYEDEQRLKRISHDSRSPSPGMFRRRRRRSGLRTSTSTSTSTSSNATATASSHHHRRYQHDLDDIYGMHLLQYLASEIQPRGVLPSVILPIVVLRGFESSSLGSYSLSDLKIPNSSASTSPSPSTFASSTAAVSRTMRYIDAGAIDVISTPLNSDNMHTLAVHAYKASRGAVRSEGSAVFSNTSPAAGFLKARPSSFLGGASAGGIFGTAGTRLSSGSGISSFGGDANAGPFTAAGGSRSARKVSWVGVNEAKPYAYLREAMVSGLMNTICNPEGVALGERIDVR